MNKTDKRINISMWLFLAFIAYFLVTEHWAHIVPFLPWLILLACPLMHVFMHGGHGHGNHAENDTHGNHSHHEEK
jgi:hypothetical protein